MRRLQHTPIAIFTVSGKPIIGGSRMGTFYENNPELRDYFESLPIGVKNRILEARVPIYTVEQLQKAAESMQNQGGENQYF